jgi:hypothetical protein
MGVKFIDIFVNSVMGNKSSSLLGHKKLETVFSSLVEQVGLKQTVLIRQVSNDRAQEVQFHRFIKNKKVIPKKLIDYSWQGSTINFAKKHLLVISDTTQVVFAPDQKREFVGYVSHNTKKEGFNLHPAILLDATDGGCYGLGGIHISRYEKSKQKKQTRSAYVKKTFEENERYKWFDAPNQAIQNCAGAECYTLVGDRESDIYALISKTKDAQWEFLYRCRTDRKIENGAKEKLYETIEGWEVEHHYDLDLKSTKRRTAHIARLDVKFGQVTIKRPKGHPDKNLPKQIEIGVIEVKEQVSTIVGNEAPIHWRLLTSHPIDDLNQVMEIIQWYIWRWIIEQLFRTFKSKGLAIENAEIKTFHGLKNLATIALLAAIQVIQLVQAREGQTIQKMENSFDEKEKECLIALNKKLEGKTAKQKNPHSNNTLAFAAWVIARLGGWKGYASERPPGPITIIRGLSQFYNVLQGFYLRL